MKQTNRIHIARPKMKLGDPNVPLCLGHLPQQPPSHEFLKALIGDDCERLEKHPALFDGIVGELWVDKAAGAKGRETNEVASELRRRALRAARPKEPPAGQDWPCRSKPQDQWCDSRGPGGFMGHTCHITIGDGVLLRGKAVLVLPVTIDDAGNVVQPESAQPAA